MFFDDHLFNFMIRRINILKLGRVKEKKRKQERKEKKGDIEAQNKLQNAK